ncbi:Ktr system potassium transporter B [Paracoccus sp. TK19116]|uniref:Ktr system potassium transporter B n=2 Tax=Paracoccus albicereus TaxID=2922394 RepID=A0ABT1MQJ0_9RHOB|nr:potassium transporter TrkG [Paracoccus albicereus]MCQ0969786.1 Ktr system potassium transporter B [Paracoccus albicereus]
MLSRWLARRPPPAVLATLYLILIIIGAALMYLPFTTTRPITVMEALFTSTSAVTVTGLVVLDTQLELTFWGQLVVLILIQLGGLGLMTFAVLVFSALGMSFGIIHQTYLREDLNQTSYESLLALVRTILRVVVLAEVAGALLLSLTFVPRFGIVEGGWHAIFHSVSAFNNAGFSTFSSGLVDLATDPLINIVIPGLVILGGIGYVVISEVRMRKFWTGWSLHTRLMIVGTIFLIVAGMLLIALLEWNNPATLGRFDDPGSRFAAAWFQSVITRTAGFNTIDVGAVHDATALLIMALMIVGAGPTSTGGGLKVTTVAVLLLATLAFFRRRTHIWAFGRSIGLEEVLKVMALVAIAAMLIFTATFLMTATQDGHFLDISFEVTSAFGTVGLSRNFTFDLTGFGQGVIMVVMFLGRVGPLTLGFFLATRVPPRVRYPEGQVHLG